MINQYSYDLVNMKEDLREMVDTIKQIQEDLLEEDKNYDILEETVMSLVKAEFLLSKIEMKG